MGLRADSDNEDSSEQKVKKKGLFSKIVIDDLSLILVLISIVPYEILTTMKLEAVLDIKWFYINIPLLISLYALTTLV